MEEHVASWSGKLPLAKSIYHFTQLDNAVNIIKTGRILSRYDSVRDGVVHHDSASQNVISQTQDEAKKFVRLYFLPLTPTQWHCEGIRPQKEYTHLNAHCPIPVFFLFDFVDLLSQDGVQFSNGNMAKREVEYGESLHIFDSIPFKSVYHRGPIEDPDPSSVTFHRHAEVLVPGRLFTDQVTMVVCRSHAERRTLLRHLTYSERKHWSPRIVVRGSGYFLREWAYVQEVTGTKDSVTFKVHPPVKRLVEAMALSFACQDEQGKLWKKAFLSTQSDITIRLAAGPPQGLVTFRIWDNEAFRDDVDMSDLPF